MQYLRRLLSVFRAPEALHKALNKLDY